MDETMDETEWIAERFEAHRPRLRAVAYRMLGSLAEADDAVQAARPYRLRQPGGAHIMQMGCNCFKPIPTGRAEPWSPRDRAGVESRKRSRCTTSSWLGVVSPDSAPPWC
jgi:hypothetical protein